MAISSRAARHAAFLAACLIAPRILKCGHEAKEIITVLLFWAQTARRAQNGLPAVAIRDLLRAASQASKRPSFALWHAFVLD